MPVTIRLVENLARLPTELALDIIKDLRVWDIVKLMLRNDPIVNHHLLAHKRCRKFLGEDAEALAKTREQVRAYLDLAERWNLDLNFPHNSIYERSLFDNRYSNWGVVETVHHRFWETIPTSVDELLAPYVDNQKGLPKVTVSSSVEEYAQYLDMMMQAKTVMSQMCHAQLLRIAALLEENPDILKRTMDTEQKRRPNTQHMVSQMKNTAEIILRRNVRSFRSREYFGYEFFPIIPFDESLETLLRRMEKHGIAADNQILTGSQHPLSMVNHAQTVVGGMVYFFPLDPERSNKPPEHCTINANGDVLRTENTSWSDEPINREHIDGVRFTPSRCTHLSSWARVRAYRGLEPHSSQEEKWLGAFIELYRYLEGLEKGSE